MKANLWHRRVAIVAAAFLLSTAVTGILWAYAAHLYLKDGYLKKKNTKRAPAFSTVRITPQQAMQNSPTPANVDNVSLRREGGSLLYEVQSKDGKKTTSILVDAISGVMISPLADAAAAAIAAEYVVGNPPVQKITQLANYRHSNGKVYPYVAVVVFAGRGLPEIIIDRQTAAIIDEVDGARRFHTWVRKLHQLQFFGTKKELTIIPGLALIFLTLSGLWILKRRWS
ncbi:MAG: PepSY domain-containing protein [Spirochaetes bacterium]|nr:PepSY domain-containing protein [Spirochaetota bacterium]